MSWEESQTQDLPSNFEYGARVCELRDSEKVPCDFKWSRKNQGNLVQATRPDYHEKMSFEEAGRKCG